jgi:hypothetical protein
MPFEDALLVPALQPSCGGTPGHFGIPCCVSQGLSKERAFSKYPLIQQKKQFKCQ